MLVSAIRCSVGIDTVDSARKRIAIPRITRAAWLCSIVSSKSVGTFDPACTIGLAIACRTNRGYRASTGLLSRCSWKSLV